MIRAVWIRALFTLLALGLAGCALGEDEVPRADLEPATCPSLDSDLEKTLAVADSGALDPLAQVVRELVTAHGGARASALMRTVLTLLREVGLSNLVRAAGTLSDGILGDIEPFAANAIRPFVQPPAGTDEAADKLLVFSLVAEAARECPEGSLTGTLLVITGDPPLVDALVLVLQDPALHEFLNRYAGPDATPSDRAALVTVIVTVLDAVLVEDFQIDDLRGALSLVLPADEAPYTTLLAEVDRVLRGERLATVQTGLGCIRGLERTDSQDRTHHGGRLVAEALYDVLAADGIDAASLAALVPADTGGLLGALDAGIRSLRSDAQLRADLLDLISFLLHPDRVRPALDGGLALLDVGGLVEIIEAVTGVLGSVECAPSDMSQALLGWAAGGDP